MKLGPSLERVVSRVPIGSDTSRSIGALLVDAGRIAPKLAESILRWQKEKNLRFGEAAIELGLLTEEDIRQALARQFDYFYLLPGESLVSPEVVAAFGTYSPSLERLRALRSQLLLRCLSPDSEDRTLAIVSPDRGEGRSYIAANLAVVFSQLGERTLLIDADLRNPRQHLLFGLDNEAGLSAVLAGRAELKDVSFDFPGLLGLTVLPAGAIPPNPQELVSRPAFSKLLNETRQNYDVILIDTPAAVTADAEAIASRASAALVIGRKNVSSTFLLQELVASLRNGGTPVVGAVLNEF